ncbi:hypothetical protein PG985_000186 [Apiospora marii]|uniref:uncharacterized protein n=1 Tax=Apiospora marii TaxID=335849 RepID=UPI00312F754F
MDEQYYYQTAGHVAAAGIGLSLLATVAVACRFQARNLTKQTLKTDDWLLLPALLLTVGVGMCLVYGVYHEAFGHRQYSSSLNGPSTLAMDQMSVSIKLEWTISLLLPVAMASTKLSLVLLYRRIFSTTSRTLLDRLLRGLAAFIVLWAVVFLAATLFCCGTMLFAIWQPVSEMAMCRFFLDVLLAFCVTGFLTDVVIFAMPIPIVSPFQPSYGLPGCIISS